MSGRVSRHQVLKWPEVKSWIRGDCSSKWAFIKNAKYYKGSRKPTYHQVLRMLHVVWLSALERFIVYTFSPIPKRLKPNQTYENLVNGEVGNLKGFWESLQGPGDHKTLDFEIKFFLHDFCFQIHEFPFLFQNIRFRVPQACFLYFELYDFGLHIHIFLKKSICDFGFKIPVFFFCFKLYDFCF